MARTLKASIVNMSNGVPSILLSAAMCENKSPVVAPDKSPTAISSKFKKIGKANVLDDASRNKKGGSI